MVFWFAVHLEELGIAQRLVADDRSLKQLVACALISKKGENYDSSSESEDEEWNINGPAD